MTIGAPPGAGWMGIRWGLLIAWAAAIVFEVAIVTLRHRLAG
jgi:hypothetical protein